MKIDFEVYPITVLGGDMRQVYLAELLAEKGFSVTSYALCKTKELSRVCRAASLQEALAGAKVILAPIPLLKAGNIFASVQAEDLTIEQLLHFTKAGSLFFAGNLPEDFLESAEKKQILCHDFMKEEYVAMQNTVATAEGMLAEAISRSPRNLYKSSCLVLGYGKCGSTLTSYLKNFSCKVSILEKNPAAAARAALAADCVLDSREFPKALQEADFIFNTIPTLVLPRALLGYVKKEAWILDLASAPGGVDYAAADTLGVHAVLLPGLPGKYAPLSSAEILAEDVWKQLFE